MTFPGSRPPPAAQRERLAAELDAALSHLRAVRDSYWDSSWRREHRGPDRRPEEELWDAVDSYLDLRDASQPGQANLRETETS